MPPATDPEPAEPPAVGVPSSQSFGAVYSEHASSVYYFALRLLGDRTLAEDATHDVFLKAYRAFGTFRGDASVRTWLYRITLNHCRTLRSTWYARTMVATAGDELAETVVSTQRGPGRELETKELGERIQSTMAQLPEEQRVVLLLAADRNLSYEEIAALTDQTVDSVRGKLHRARKTFMQKFQKSA